MVASSTVFCSLLVNHYDFTYSVSDMNGDGFVDGNDFPVFDVNSAAGVTAVHP